MYYHPLALVKSGHVTRAGELAELAFDSWATQQQRCIEAMEEIWSERLRALPVLWGSRDPFTFAIHSFAFVAPAGFQYVELAAREAACQVDAQCSLAAVLRRWTADWVEQVDSFRPQALAQPDAPEVRKGNVDKLAA